MTAVRVLRREVPLAAENAVQHWATRQSLLLCVQVQAGLSCGEACPLPGVSSETFTDIDAWLNQDPDLTPLFDAPYPAVLDQTARLGLPASLRYAIELACFDGHARQLGLPLFHLLLDLSNTELSSPVHRVPARLFQLWQDDYLQRCEDLVANMAETSAAQRSLSGALALKIKVGRDPHVEAIRLGELRRHFPTLRLRLDANRALSPTSWERDSELFARHEIEFIEEPCPPQALGAPRSLAIPIAFDETLHEGLPQDIAVVQSWLDSAAVGALVLKPMLLGGFEKCLEWVARARQSETDVIFSHAFDGTVAMRSYQHWDRAFGSARFAPGLGQHAGLALWHELEAPSLEGRSAIELPGLGLNWSRLAELYPSLEGT